MMNNFLNVTIVIVIFFNKIKMFRILGIFINTLQQAIIDLL